MRSRGIVDGVAGATAPLPGEVPRDAGQARRARRRRRRGRGAARALDAELRARLGELVYGDGDESLASVVGAAAARARRDARGRRVVHRRHDRRAAHRRARLVATTSRRRDRVRERDEGAPARRARRDPARARRGVARDRARDGRPARGRGSAPTSARRSPASPAPTAARPRSRSARCTSPSPGRAARSTSTSSGRERATRSGASPRYWAMALLIKELKTPRRKWREKKRLFLAVNLGVGDDAQDRRRDHQDARHRRSARAAGRLGAAGEPPRDAEVPRLVLARRRSTPCATAVARRHRRDEGLRAPARGAGGFPADGERARPLGRASPIPPAPRAARRRASTDAWPSSASRARRGPFQPHVTVGRVKERARHRRRCSRPSSKPTSEARGSARSCSTKASQSRLVPSTSARVPGALSPDLNVRPGR